MKRFLTYINIALVVLSVMSCTKEGGQKPQGKPIFPEPITVKMTPGEECTFSTMANLSCEISLPVEKSSMFWFDDNGMPSSKLKVNVEPGKVQSLQVKVQSASYLIFDNAPVCDITMTMASESKVIATVILETAERYFSVYPCKLKENGDFMKVGGKYEYEEKPATELDMKLMWGTNFELPIKVEANFDWNLIYPEWILQTTQTGGKAGSKEILIKTNGRTFPTEGATDEIDIREENTLLDDFFYTLSISDTRHTGELSGRKELAFDKLGGYEDMNGDMAEFYIVNFMSTEGYRVVALEKQGDVYTAEEAEWVSVVPDIQWNQAGDRIQTLPFRISAEVNETGATRDAIIFFLPESIAQVDDFDVDKLFSTDGKTVKEEYEQYMATLTQSAVAIADEESEMSLASGDSCLFEELPTEDILRPWINYFMDKWGLERLYSLTYNSTLSTALLNYGDVDKCYSFELYDFETETQITGEDVWASADMSSDLIRVYMNTEVRREGFILMMDKDGDVLDAIYCLFDPEAEIVTAAPFSFQYPELVEGATLEVCSDEMWETLGEEFFGLTQNNCYILTYTSASPKNAMLVGPGGEPDFGEAFNESKWLTYEWMEDDMMYVYMTESGKQDYFVWKTPDGYFHYVLVCTANFN